jgi:hypothetical protein
MSDALRCASKRLNVPVSELKVTKARPIRSHLLNWEFHVRARSLRAVSEARPALILRAARRRCSPAQFEGSVP